MGYYAETAMIIQMLRIVSNLMTLSEVFFEE
jgi:hypothetical protein